MIKTEDITIAILCGGKSSRMGQDKGLMEINAKSLISYTIENIQKTNSKIILCSNNPAYRTFGFPVYEDIQKDVGPAGGILTALSYSQTKWTFVISCDMPLLSPDFINHLLQSVHEKDQALIPFHHGFYEPLCGIYSKAFLPHLKSQLEWREFKLIQILNTALDVHFMDVSIYLNEVNPLIFQNINRPEDITDFLQYL